MSDRPYSQARWWLWGAVLLTAFKLWLTDGQHVFAIGSAGHDDRLFLQLAEHILRGEWLGPYTQMTLAKGAFYSFWVAFVFWLGLPLFLSQQLFYAAACALLVRAAWPALRSAAAAFAIYALLLWNPMTYDASSLGRVLRQHVYSPLTMLVLAALVSLYYRRQESWRRQVPWAVLLGVAFGGFWLTREESVWIVPSVALLAGAVLYGAWQNSRATWYRSLQALGLAAVCAALPVMVVSALNYHYYRWFGTVEFRAPEFNDAYGAMVRVRIGPDLPFVPVTREARAAMYAVSPAFAELRPQLEGAIGYGWAEASGWVTKLPPEQRQIGSGWLMWALRDAVVASGHGHDAREALAFYQRMADEINRACEDGRLPAGPRRSGFLPVWREGQSAEVGRTFLTFADFVVSFQRFSAFAPESVGDDGTLALFRDLTKDQLSPSAEATNLKLPNQTVFDHWRIELLNSIGKGLRRLIFGLFCLAQLVALIRVGQMAWLRRWTFPLTLAAAAWGAGVTYLLINAVIQVTSFPVLVISSFAPAYPMVLIFIAAALWDAWTAWAGARLPDLAAWFHPGPVPAAPVGIPLSDGLSRALPWLAGLMAMAPFLIYRRQFAELFWFGDDYFLIDQIAQMGVWHWTWQAFSENFVPLFKLAWSGVLLGFDGNYQAMLWLMWLTHALNTICVGRLLHRAGFPWVATVVTQIVFALAPANIETLGWSVQWSAVLATTFLLLGLLWQEKNAADPRARSPRVHGPLVAFATASACCFSRGVLTGPVLALGQLQLGAAGPRKNIIQRVAAAGLCLLPAITVAILIMSFSSGNQQHMGGHWAEAVEFGLGFFLLNPGYLLVGATTLAPGTLILLSLLKLGVVGGGLWRARGRVRALLLLFLAYDLGNAVLLGVGRYHTGFVAALSSRYYYSSLLATLPFAALLLALALERLPRLRLRQLAAALLVAGLIWHGLRGWPADLDGFVAWRGTAMRKLMATPRKPGEHVTVPALDFMQVERAKALIKAYDLH